MPNDNNKGVTGRQGFTVLVQDQDGQTLTRWDACGERRVYIVDDRSRLRTAMVAVSELAEFMGKWIAEEPLPREGIGINVTK